MKNIKLSVVNNKYNKIMYISKIFSYFFSFKNFLILIDHFYCNISNLTIAITLADVNNLHLSNLTSKNLVTLISQLDVFYCI